VTTAIRHDDHLDADIRRSPAAHDH